MLEIIKNVVLRLKSGINYKKYDMSLLYSYYDKEQPINGAKIIYNAKAAFHALND